MALFHWTNVCGGQGMKMTGVNTRKGPPFTALTPCHASSSPTTTMASTTRTCSGRSPYFVKKYLHCSLSLKINHAMSPMILDTSCWGGSIKIASMASMHWNFPHRSSVRRRREMVNVANSAALAAAADNEPVKPSTPLSEKVVAFQKAFWKFLRPHTIRGTILGSMAVTAKALLENPTLIDWALLPRALLGVLALLCGNGYIVGINQIYDVDIDAVNKPFLPVAAGELSPVIAWILCGGLAAAGLAITIRNFGPLISKLYGFGLFLGTIYSVPPLRLKRSAFAAFLIIATVRGFLLNFGVYHAVRAALGLSFQWNPAITFITIFVTIFATVIAITKDLPDVEGDRKFGIETFATRLGVRRISFLGSGLLLANYIGAMAAAVFLPHLFNPSVMIPSHALLGTALLWKAIKLDAARYTQDSIAGYYRFIWNLFYLEYLILPFL